MKRLFLFSILIFNMLNAQIEEKGSLHIIVHPDSSEIYFDGYRVKGNPCVMEELPVGRHSIYATYKDKSKEKIVFVIANKLQKVKIQLERETFYHVISSFSQIWCNGFSGYGPSADWGIKKEKHYYGINFHWDFWSRNTSKIISPIPGEIRTTEFISLGGAFIQYYYDLYSIADILYLSPGLCSGFWYFEGKKERFMTNNGEHWQELKHVDTFFVTGLSARATLGYKYIFATCAYTLLLGPDNIGHALVIGINYKI